MSHPAPKTVSAAQPHPRSWRSRLRTVVLAGLLILAPLYLTLYVLRLLFRLMDGIFAPLIDRTLGVHIPGLGLLLTVLVVLSLGWLSTNVVGRRVFDSVERLIRRIPVAKSVYGATKGVLEAVSRDQADAFKRVVLVEYPRRGIWGIGFVTAASLRWAGVDPRVSDLVPVFVPTTPNPTSGYLLLVPPAEVVDCPISVEDGIRMVVSGGILQPEVADVADVAEAAPALGAAAGGREPGGTGEPPGVLPEGAVFTAPGNPAPRSRPWIERDA